ncbi:asparaginase [Bordetella genomosp. 13]|uniref:L-asparaginase n=1 Tax=Bordetella genomosp. 13 TaxID=463040 RepID=A0A1W6ZJ07_9BORD|nr:asparaginase [Bordetella genomosp. 13]ARP97130.1 L-asparaginase [Bordetella genomosp. 13]
MPDAALPTIALLATGGTIAGAQTGEPSGAYRAGSLPVEALLSAVPGLQRLARLQPEQVASVGSQNIGLDTWATLVERVQALCADPSIDGIVITHGTDTLEETAYLLSLVLPWSKPVVLVGAMRPATALGADGPANLYNAVALAAHPQAFGRGPLVLMNDEIHEAALVQKMAANGVDAFASPNGGRAGTVHAGTPRFVRPAGAALPARFALPPRGDDGSRDWPVVDIVHAHAGMDGAVVDFMAARARGIVLAGVGDGNASDAVLDALERAALRGVAVVRSTRTGSGWVGRNVEVDDDARHFIAAGPLSPQKARVLLMLALAAGVTQAEAQALFEQA